MKKHLLMLALASTSLRGHAGQRHDQGRIQGRQGKIEVDYKVAKAQCDLMKDITKDVCQKGSQGQGGGDKAELEQQVPAERQPRPQRG